MNETTFAATIHIGDAGDPFEINITVMYREKDNVVVVTSSETDDEPINAPDYWNATVGEKIEDYFNPKTVVFL